MNINSIEELKQLAGILKNEPVTQVVSEPEIVPTEQSSCGCGSNDEMRKYIDIVPSDIKFEEDDLEEEWANSTEHFDGEERIMDQPRGEIVDLSLRRHLKAKGDHVTVDESSLHTPEKMLESYKKFKKTDEENSDEENSDETDKEIKEDNTPVIVTFKDLKENKVVRKKFRNQKTFENWKKSDKSKNYKLVEKTQKLSESIDLTKLKKNAGLI